MTRNKITGFEILEISDISSIEEDANSGTMEIELIEHYGRTGKELTFTERRKKSIIGAYPRGIITKDKDGYELALALSFHPNLVEYDRNTLTIYNPRKGTSSERGNIRERYRVTFDGIPVSEKSKVLKLYRETFSNLYHNNFKQEMLYGRV